MDSNLLSFMIVLIAWAIIMYLYMEQSRKLRSARRVLLSSGNALAQAHKAVRDLSMENTDLKVALRECRRLAVFLESKVRYTPSKKVPSSSLSRDEITSLLKLCHPDRHGNSAEANKVSAKLITLRESL